MHQALLLAQQVEHRLVLLFVKRVRVLDAEFRALAHQVQRGIGHGDRHVECLHAALVGLSVGQRLFLEHHAPAGGRVLEHLGAVQQQVRRPLERHAVVPALDGVPGSVLQPRIDAGIGRHARGVDRLHLAGGNQAQRGIAGCGHQVESALVHQGHHLLGVRGRAHRDLAAGVLLEGADPVVGRIAGAAFGVTRPDQQVELALEHRLGRSRGRGSLGFGGRLLAAGRQGHRDHAGQHDELRVHCHGRTSRWWHPGRGGARAERIVTASSPGPPRAAISPRSGC